MRRLLQRAGRFPADVKADLQRERLVLIAEGIPGTLSSGDRTQGTAASLAITQFRLAVYAMQSPLIDVTWDSGEARELDITAADTGLTIAYDAERFGGDGETGSRVLALRIGDAPALLAAIDQRRRELPPRRRRDD